MFPDNIPINFFTVSFVSFALVSLFFIFAITGGNHDAQAKAKALAEAALRKNEKKSFGSLL